MNHRPTDLERAFELARSGRCSRVEDLRTQLRKEGYSVDRLTGRTLIKQLQALIQAGQGGNGPCPLGPADAGSQPRSRPVGLPKAGFTRAPGPDQGRE
jgi:hypothetical protein